jgi:hypothetical protein
MRLGRIRAVLALLLVGSVGLASGAQLAAAQEATPGASPVVSASGVEGAVAWLESKQLDDGGFPGFSEESDPGFTLDVLVALGAARNGGVDAQETIDAAVEYLAAEDHALVYAQTGVGQAAKLILGLTAVGIDATEFANVMPLTIIEAGIDAETGLYGTGLYDHALTILALSALGEDVPQPAIDLLATSQAENGGWGFDGSPEDANVDSNTTAMVVQALAAAGQGDSEMTLAGLEYLDAVWTDGGATYGLTEGSVPDSNSTALVIQAFVAAGRDVSGLEPALAGFQNASGAFFFNEEDNSDNSFSTVQAIPAMTGEAFPIIAADTNAASIATISASWHEYLAA